jgi:hypothetical protein
MAEEPTIRVRNGSVTVTIDSTDPTVKWFQHGPLIWRRLGAVSTQKSDRWLDVDGKFVENAGNTVRVSTPDGDLFFVYSQGRTLLNTNITLEQTDDRVLSKLDTRAGVRVSVLREDLGEPEWVDARLGPAASA